MQNQLAGPWTSSIQGPSIIKSNTERRDDWTLKLKITNLWYWEKNIEQKKVNVGKKFEYRAALPSRVNKPRYEYDFVRAVSHANTQI